MARKKSAKTNETNEINLKGGQVPQIFAANKINGGLVPLLPVGEAV